MKSTITILLLVCLPVFGFTQNVKMTIGRGTNCFGRGACSISTENSNNYNANFVQNANGVTSLRIYRDKLTREEEDRVLGVPINSVNQNLLKFVMDEPLVLPENLKQLTAPTRSKQLDTLKQGTYQTVITAAYIDIKLVDL